MDIVGTIYTMAPEVLSGNYTAQADLWSVGVIAYMLLSSQCRFMTENVVILLSKYCKCKYDFMGRRWKRISPQAKAFIEDLLVVDPDERATAEVAAASTWLSDEIGILCKIFEKHDTNEDGSSGRH
jgi:serine/threonine protein kinase